jgi:hypothetical protein
MTFYLRGILPGFPCSAWLAHLVSYNLTTISLASNPGARNREIKMSDNNKHASIAIQGKYDHLAAELAERLEAEFSLLVVLGGKQGNGMSVQHSYADADKPEKMRRLAKMFDFLADWARREAGDVAAH